MGAILAGAAIAGTALQAYGQIRGGQKAKDAYDYNAAVAKQEADFQEKRTEQDLAFHREDVERIIGKQRVTGGAGGTTGSQSILLDTLTQAELDEQMIKTEGAINVWRAKTAAKRFEESGEEFRTAGYIAGGSTLLGGLSRFDYRKKGPSTKPQSRNKAHPYYGKFL